MATFQARPLQIKAIQFNNELKAVLCKRTPSFDAIVPFQPDGMLHALAYYNQNSGSLEMSTYGNKNDSIKIPLGGWMIYEIDGKSTRKYMTDKTFREVYQPL